MAQANLKIISTAYPIEKGVPLPETVARGSTRFFS
jgi:hypothetical protein